MLTNIYTKTKMDGYSNTNHQPNEDVGIKTRQFKDEMQRVLMKQRILRKEYDSQVIFWVCD